MHTFLCILCNFVYNLSWMSRWMAGRYAANINELAVVS